MKIHGFQSLTLLDYPGKLSALLFLGSCNFRCPFCQNSTLVLSPDTEPVLPWATIKQHLLKRKNILEGVCISGGEPTLHADLPKFIKEIKDMGYAVKLDTNGSNPDMVRNLVSQQLLDYVAMDIKSSPEHYALAGGCPDSFLPSIRECADFLMRSGLPFEFRTTVVEELHTEADFTSIASWLAGDELYYLQPFRNCEQVLEKGLHAPSSTRLQSFLDILSKTIPNATIRGDLS